MEFQYIFILIVVGLFFFGCTNNFSGGEGQTSLAGTWRAAENENCYMKFESDGAGRLLGSCVFTYDFNYSIVDNKTVKITFYSSFNPGPVTNTETYDFVDGKLIISRHGVWVR